MSSQKGRDLFIVDNSFSGWTVLRYLEEWAGNTRWYLYELGTESILEDPGQIVASIRSEPSTPRECTTSKETLVDIRFKVERHIKNSYLKRVNAPAGVRQQLKCWMELSEG
jgi:hypothetical protein